MLCGDGSEVQNRDPWTQDCGHDRTDDSLLFSTARLQTEPSKQQGKATILAYDDRLAEHEEGDAKDVHPERPDRIKAVIARLMSTGLAGEQWCLTNRQHSVLQAFYASSLRGQTGQRPLQCVDVNTPKP